MVTILVMLIVGAIAGFLARAIVPGRDSMGAVGTILLGIVGALLGGFLFSLFGGPSFSASRLNIYSVLGATVGAVIALLIYRAVAGRSSTARL